VIDGYRKDPRNRWFGAAEVAEAINVPRAVLHAWLARGHVTVPSRGQGKSRLFSFDTAVELAVIAQLTKLPMTIGAAVAALDAVKRHFREAFQANYGAGRVLAIIDGESRLLGAESLPGFATDWGAKRFAAVVIHNVAKDVHAALLRQEEAREAAIAAGQTPRRRPRLPRKRVAART
jgi:DNA-binding transcriptional MerR regulator